jgi:Zn-dependent peptidase ImmA (M78 family)/transcriptional regulator with XRE-family HTH domain
MIDAAQLGSRLRAARERRGLSQQAVADALKLPRTAVTNMETGNRTVSTLELARLADLYAQPAAFFLGAEPTEAEDLSVVLTRALPEIEHAPDIDAAVRRMLDLYGEGAILRKMLDQTGDQTLPNYAARMTSTGDAIRQGEHVAQEERGRLGLGNAPIGNIAELIASQGVWTAATKLPDSLSGLFFNHPSVGLAILVNAQHWPVRKRFSYAHECAHALLDREETVTTTRRENASQLVEKRANAFAAAFLMPSDGIEDQLRQLQKGAPSRQSRTLFDVAGNAMIEAEIRPPPKSQAITYQDVAAIAHHFKVSYEAAAWRLKNLGWLNAPETDALIEQKSVGKRYGDLLGFKDNLFDEIPSKERYEDQELRGQLARLTIEAYRREEISRGRLLELGRKLDLPGDELLDLAEATRGD